MSIRPVDMQVMIQRMPEVNRLTNNDGSRAETQNNQFAQQFAKVADERQKTVGETDEAQKQELDKDGRGRGGSTGGQNDDKEADGQDDKNNPPKPGRGMLDIMI
ncbi:MAG: hypothetical protein FWE21_01385 [Defluviitaleaceae bacterium]|nr:hypothetical protein [Defluviitaleaceae bacterium]